MHAIFKKALVASAVLVTFAGIASACPNMTATEGSAGRAGSFGPADAQGTATGVVPAGGPFQASKCGHKRENSFFSAEPTIVFTWLGTKGPLFFDAIGEGGTDTALLIRAPDGSIHSNDKFAGGSTDAAIDFHGPQAPQGTYLIWVGTNGPTQGSARVVITPRITR